jgi:hypothetical protein
MLTKSKPIFYLPDNKDCKLTHCYFLTKKSKKNVQSNIGNPERTICFRPN